VFLYNPQGTLTTSGAQKNTRGRLPCYIEIPHDIISILLAHGYIRVFADREDCPAVSFLSQTGSATFLNTAEWHAERLETLPVIVVATTVMAAVLLILIIRHRLRYDILGTSNIMLYLSFG